MGASEYYMYAVMKLSNFNPVGACLSTSRRQSIAGTVQFDDAIPISEVCHSESASQDTQSCSWFR